MNLGVIGVGSMGQNHARVCSELTECNFAGICDKNEDTGKLVANRLNTTLYTNLSEFLKEVDAVTIATPTTTHYNIAKQALEAGKHVLVEKPMCSDAVQAQELCDIAKQQGLTLAVGHIERHNPVVAFAKNLLRSGECGQVLSLSGKRVGGPGAKRIQDVGVILDLGIHEIDNCRYLTGSEVESIGAFGGSHTHKFEDYMMLTLAMASGACANIEVNWMTPMRIRKLDITASEKFVELDYINQKVKLSSAELKDENHSNLYQMPWEYNTRMLSLKKQEPLKLEIRDFLRAIKQHAPPLVTGEDGLAAVKVADAAVKAYKERRLVDVRDLY